MEKTVYIGHIQNAICDAKTLVVAENPEDAKAQVMAKFSDGPGKTYQESDVTVLPCAWNY